MNVFLWILQVALAFLFLAGGAYKTFAFAEVAAQLPAIPHAGWRAIGVLEMIGGVLLVVPSAAKWWPVLTPVAAGVLALEAAALAGVYGRYSVKLTAENPLVWSVALAIGAAVVAYGRSALRPVG